MSLSPRLALIPLVFGLAACVEPQAQSISDRQAAMSQVNARIAERAVPASAPRKAAVTPTKTAAAKKPAASAPAPAAKPAATGGRKAMTVGTAREYDAQEAEREKIRVKLYD